MPRAQRLPTGTFAAIGGHSPASGSSPEPKASDCTSRPQRLPTGTFTAISSEPSERRARLSDAPVVVALPCRKELVSSVVAVRGTVLLASIHALREQGCFDAYRQHLDKESAAKVLSIVPGEWVAIEESFAHYRACEALQAHPSEQLAVGRCAGAKVIGTMLGTAVRLSNMIGATPWLLLKGADRIWNRAYNGGGIRVLKLGPNDALVEAHANPLLCQLAFCRNSFRGFVLSLYGSLNQQISIREAEVTARCVSFRLVWK